MLLNAGTPASAAQFLMLLTCTPNAERLQAWCKHTNALYQALEPAHETSILKSNFSNLAKPPVLKYCHQLPVAAFHRYQTNGMIRK